MITNKEILELGGIVTSEKDAETRLKEVFQWLALQINNQKSKGSYSMYDFVAKDKLHPILTGVYHDNGMAVACDSHCLLVSKDKYMPVYEGKIVSKDGKIIEGKYPKYKAVIPAKEKYNATIKLKKPAAEFLYEYRKADKYSKEDYNVYWGDLDRHHYAISMKYYMNVLNLAECLGFDSMRCIVDDTYHAICSFGDNYTFLIMPVWLKELRDFSTDAAYENAISKYYRIGDLVTD